KFYISKPFPDHRTVAHVVRERAGSDDALAVLSVRPKSKIDSIDTSVTGHARKSRDKNLRRTSVKFRGRYVGRDLSSGVRSIVIKEHEIKIRIVIDTRTAKFSKPHDGHRQRIELAPVAT